jgi:hypothetical protein
LSVIENNILLLKKHGSNHQLFLTGVRFCVLEAYRALVVMGFQEVQQWVKALLVLEQLGRQVTVKELHPISDGLGHGRTWEGGIERLKIKLKHKLAAGAVVKKKRTNSYKLFTTSRMYILCLRLQIFHAGTYCSSTSCSLNARYSETVSSSTANSLTFTRM